MLLLGTFSVVGGFGEVSAMRGQDEFGFSELEMGSPSINAGPESLDFFVMLEACKCLGSSGMMCALSV